MTDNFSLDPFNEESVGQSALTSEKSSVYPPISSNHQSKLQVH
jgi:hypothetical protein